VSEERESDVRARDLESVCFAEVLEQILATLESKEPE
jgi:hypothetical protein